MATAPKAHSGPARHILPGWLEQIAQYALGRGRTLSLMLLLVAGLTGLWWMVWRDVQQRVLAGSDYLVEPTDVAITPLPPWIHSDVQAEVLRDASLDPPLSILEEDLAERVATAFSFHPWVAKVQRVSKHYPARVVVELAYRRPALMVEVADGLLPVDTESVLLPTADFSPVEASQYPLLEGIDTVPVGPVGARWGDERVAGAAEIAGVLLPAWHELRLARIVPLETIRQGQQQEFTYELHTLAGTRIYWGLAPSTTSPGEMPAEEKLARLREYAAEHRGLDDPHGPPRLDIRELPLP